MKPLPFLAAAQVGARSVTPSPAVRDPRRPAVIVPIQHTDAEAIASACREIAASGIVDVIEWRIDPLVAALASPVSGAGTEPVAEAGAQAIDANTVAEAVADLSPHVTAAGLPVLLTLRSGFEGGQVEVSEADYAEVVRRVASVIDASAPLAVDVEIARTAADELIDALAGLGVTVVASRHDFDATDSVVDMTATFTQMRRAGADVVKIAMMPHSPSDVADLLRATAEADASLDCPVLGISMGEAGRASRLLGGDFGGCATFAQMGTASAPGQIDAAELAAMFDLLYR